MWRLSFLRAAGNVHFHQPCIGVQPSPGSLLHLLFIDMWQCPFWLMGFDFLLFWLSFPSLIIMFCGCLGFLSIKNLESLPVIVAVWMLILFGIYFCNTAQDLSWGQLVITAPEELWIGGASAHCWSSCNYRKCPQGNSSSSCPTVIPLARRSLRKNQLPGLWIIVEST